ncbi:MAG TPA: heteromeric transposase endonuclease subunit TnsA [Kamptonema sp.]|nr:heteromeric transposase endonuclease subunit TnsA [Kamptonema sp.]
MLSNTEFNTWCSRFNLSQQTQTLIEKIRSSEPSRRVGGGTKNVSGRYPSRKMGVTIQFESHKVELPFIYELEHDEDVLEFYDQPHQIKLDYEAKNGRKLGVLHTPDFFVIRTNFAGWEECKTEQELKRLSEKNPNRYFCSDDSKWLSPPGEVYAKKFGLYYRIRSDNQINWILQRNLIFLEDYLRATSITLEESVTNSIISRVFSQPGITLAELLHQEIGIIADDIYTLIATEQLYVNLNSAPLAEPERCQVFSDQQTSLAYQLMVKQSTPRIAIISPVINLATGTSIIWDGKGLTILHIGETEILLRAEDAQLIELKKTEFENLVRQGKIKNLQTQERQIGAESWERFHQASPEDQAEALRRYKAIEPYLNGQPPKNETVPERTIRDWKAKY